MDDINNLVMSAEEKDVASSEIKKGEQKETKEVPIFTKNAVKNVGVCQNKTALKLKRLKLMRLKMVPGRERALQKLTEERENFIKLYCENLKNPGAASKRSHEAGAKTGAIRKQLHYVNNGTLMKRILALTQRIAIINSMKSEIDEIEKEVDKIISILEKREISQSENININPATICSIENRRNCIRQEMPDNQRDNRLKAVNLKRGLVMNEESKEASNSNSALDLASIAEALPAESHPSKSGIDAYIEIRNNIMRKVKSLVEAVPYDAVKQMLLDTNTEIKANETSD